MEENTTLLEGYSDREKGAYLGAIASLATADREASEEEMEHIEELCSAAGLSAEQTAAVRQAATELPGEELNRCLDVLKSSELKYSLVTDLMAFAKADNDYSEAEEQSIQKISQYLGLNQQQVSLLDQFSQQATQQASSVQPAAPSQQNFLGGGLQEKLQGAGINTGSLMKGVLAIAAPMILSRMLSGGRRGGFGGGMGGMLGGGLGGMMGGGGLGGMMGGGGLGSLIGMLSGGRGMRGTGGLLGRMLGGRF